VVTEPGAFKAPQRAELQAFLKEKIDACKSLFAEPPVTVIECETVLKEKEKADEEE